MIHLVSINLESKIGMLKKTVVILFVTTLVAFSLVTANIIAASNMSIAAYAKKGHSDSGGSSS